MDMGRGVATMVVSVVVATAFIGLFIHGGGAQPLATPSDEDPVAQSSEPILVYDIHVQPDGDAVWNVTAQFPTMTPAETDAFDTVAATFQEANEPTLSVDPFEVTARSVSEELDRSMWIDEVDRSVSRTNDTGILVLSFTWNGFAETHDSTIFVGDVFDAKDYTWLATLQENEFVRIHAPDGYMVESSGMAVDEHTMWASGPADLSEEHLRGTFVEIPETDESDEDRPIIGILGGAGIGVAVLAFLLLLLYHREYAPIVTAVTWFDTSPSTSTEPKAASPDSEMEESPKAADGPLENRELLSDEELVLALIEHHGGRMKQAEIVTETDWSNAKVSQLLSQMAEEGEIEKLRIGRENLISLPDGDRKKSF